MNTTTAQADTTRNMRNTSTTRSTRLPALALASLLTAAMLLAVNHLAQTDSPAPQMAQASQARG